MRRARAVLLATALLCASLASAEPPSIESLGRLPVALAECSGVAASRSQPGVLWAHNDSGGGPRLFAISPSGEVLARFLLDGVRAVDWEDIALGPCPGADEPCLFVADTGDNLEERRSVTIRIVPEPTVGPKPVAQTRTIAPRHSVRVRYADGPHDVEAIAFDPAGNVLLISKGQRSPIRVYRIARADLAKEAALAELADLDTVAPRTWLGGWVTGAATSPEKQRLVVRTYTELSFYRFADGGKLVRDGSPCELGFVEPQGEGVDFLDEHTLVLISESRGGRPGEILRVRCPR
jgi:hypothetical protein